MILLTDPKDGGPILVNPEFVVYVVAGLKSGSVLVFGQELAVTVDESVDQVLDALSDAAYEVEYAPEEPQEPADDEIRVSGVPYPVPASSIHHSDGDHVDD